ncbi:MAG: TetR/AcrR family transcriptional regulator [Acidimicrobiales bacterium]
MARVAFPPGSDPPPEDGGGPEQGRPRRGRPRSEAVRLAVLEAAADLLLEGGLAAATIEGIAARARVSKVTIYRWWPSRGSVAIDAYFHRFRHTIDVADSGDVDRDLTAQLERLIGAFDGRPGVVMSELIGQAQSDPALAETLRTRWLEPRRAAAVAVLERAVGRDQVRSDADLTVLMDQLYAPIYYRLIMGHLPLDRRLAGTLVADLLDGVRKRSPTEGVRSSRAGPSAPITRRVRPEGPARRS